MSVFMSLLSSESRRCTLRALSTDNTYELLDFIWLIYKMCELLNPVYTIQPVEQLVESLYTRYNWLNNQLYRVYKHSTSCWTGCMNSTRLIHATQHSAIHLQSIVQLIWQTVVSCKRGLNGAVEPSLTVQQWWKVEILCNDKLKLLGLVLRGLSTQTPTFRPSTPLRLVAISIIIYLLIFMAAVRSRHRRTTLSGYIFAKKARIDNRNKTC